MLAQVLPFDIVQKILCMAVPHTNSPDVMIWTTSTCGGFSLSSTFQELRDVKTSSFTPKQFWHSQVPLKLSFFMLLLLRRRLLLDDVLSRFMPHLPSKCFCCLESQSKTLQHLFMEGELAVAVWNFFGSLCGVNIARGHLRVYLACWWYKPTKLERLKFVFRLLPIFVCWNLWKARNIAVFQGIAKDAHSIFRAIFPRFKGCLLAKVWRVAACYGIASIFGNG
ncbi:uncharacterized protein [Coffea arabica]|uniref:Reverse transcriptase zinc-binding domain-containing protein n=1 Tax=Coffea arabica TaxID=13443 RepID=A0ABM4UFM6_COFAR